MIRKLKIVCTLFYESIFSSFLLYFLCRIWLDKPFFKAYAVYIFIMYFAIYLIREYADTMLFPTLFLVGFMVGLYFLKLPVSVLVLLGLISFHVLGDTYLYLKRVRRIKSGEDVPWPSFLFCFIAYIAAWFSNMGATKQWAYITLLILLLIYFVMSYLNGLSKYMEATKNVSLLPLKSMLKVNTTIVAMLVAAIFIIILLVNTLDFTGLLLWLKKLALEVFKVFVSGFMFTSNLLSKLMGGGTGSIDAAQAAPERVAEGQNGYMDSGFFFLLEAALFIILFVYAVKLIKRVIKFLLEKQINQGDVVEKIDFSEQRDNNNRRFFGKKDQDESQRNRFRRLFKSFVLRYEDEITLKKSTTTKEIQEELYSKSEIDADEVCDMYKAVRYGEKLVDRKTVKELKQKINKASSKNR